MRVLLVLWLLGLGGCGYKPIASFADKVLGKGVYVRLVVNMPNPKNSVEFKDLINRVVVQRFQNTLTSEKQADSIITIEMTKVLDTSISQNQEGFTTFYRVTTYVTYTYDNKMGTTKSFEFSGYYNYAVSLQNPLITYNNRLYAISQALDQTMTQFVSQIAYEGKVNK